MLSYDIPVGGRYFGNVFGMYNLVVQTGFMLFVSYRLDTKKMSEKSGDINQVDFQDQ
jgi:hypothetical protein